ncbi:MULTISPECIES: hypothetical protein [Streptomyces]|uniref:hypothetical protein n=1 Tax=Streptomyces TaxID=1883 RepID=UPI001297E0E6|nr:MULTISPECIES: hypothetical protein [Streptomyces]
MLRTTIGGEIVDLPGTLEGIRASLPEEQRNEFEREIWSAPLTEVPLIAARWGRPQEAHDEDEALVQQLRAGDFSGFTSLEDDTLEAGR